MNSSEHSGPLFEPLIGGEVGLDVSGGYVVDLNDAHAYHLRLMGDTALYFTGAPAPFQSPRLTFFLTQGSDAPASISWPSCIKWSAAAPPSLSKGTRYRDLIILETDDSGVTRYDVQMGIGYRA